MWRALHGSATEYSSRVEGRKEFECSKISILSVGRRNKSLIYVEWSFLPTWQLARSICSYSWRTGAVISVCGEFSYLARWLEQGRSADGRSGVDQSGCRPRWPMTCWWWQKVKDGFKSLDIYSSTGDVVLLKSIPVPDEITRVWHCRSNRQSHVRHILPNSQLQRHLWTIDRQPNRSDFFSPCDGRQIHLVSRTFGSWLWQPNLYRRIFPKPCWESLFVELWIQGFPSGPHPPPAWNPGATQTLLHPWDSTTHCWTDVAHQPLLLLFDFWSSSLCEDMTFSNKPWCSIHKQLYSSMTYILLQSQSFALSSRDKSKTFTLSSRDKSKTFTLSSRDKSKTFTLSSRDMFKTFALSSRDKSKTFALSSRDKSKTFTLSSRD